MGPAILWAVINGVALGVLARSLIVFEWWTVAFFLLLAGATAFVAYLRADRRAILLSIVLVAVAAGSARMHIAVLSVDPQLAAYVGHEVRIEGVVADKPDVRENSIRVPVRVHMAGESAVSGKVLAIVPLHNEVAYGDVVRIDGELRLPESFETGEGRIFDYPSFLAKSGISHEVAFASIERLSTGEGNLIKAGAITIQQWYLQGIAAALSEPAAGLAGGITVGDKRGVGTALSDVFQTVSLTHIIVLSGYNIMIVIFGLMWLLEYFKLGKWWQFSIGVVVAIFFALITGLAAASVRAAAMAIIAMIGKVSGRVYLAGRALGFVALGMVFWNPYVLVFDPGFQLSVIATTGLIALAPLITPYLSRVPEILNMRDVVASSLSAQIVVLPLLIYQSGIVSLYAFPANLLTLVVVPYAMLLSLIAAVLGLVAGPLAPILAFPAYALLAYIIAAAQFFASLPFASISIPAFDISVLVFVYALLVVWVWKKKTATQKPPHSIAVGS